MSASRSARAGPSARAFTAGHVSALKNMRGWSRRMRASQFGVSAAAHRRAPTAQQTTVMAIFMPQIIPKIGGMCGTGVTMNREIVVY